MTTKLIAIVGPSGSGKTTTARTLSKSLVNRDLRVDVISQDDFYKPIGHQSSNYDHPQALDLQLMTETLHVLKSGHGTMAPTYDFITHRRKAEMRRIKASDIILVEGLFLMTDPKLFEVFDVTIYLNTPQEVCLQRRLQRDQYERGRNPDDILRQYHKQVKPGYVKFIAPHIDKASFIIDELPPEIDTFIDQLLSHNL